MKKLRGLLGIVLAWSMIAVGPSAHAATTSGAVVTAVRLNVDAAGFLRIEFDKDLNCGSRLGGGERLRAYVLAPVSPSSPDTAPTQDDVNRMQNLATAALLAGKNVLVIVDETKTTGFWATHCKLSEIILSA